MMKLFKVPDHFNYVGIYLTLRCNFKCPYCITEHGNLQREVEELSTSGWIEGLSRIETRPDLPITLQGGEPTLHPGCWDIANALWRQDKPLDILTNGSFNVPEFTAKVKPEVFQRNAKYANIRVSFHPPMHDANALATKVFTLQNMGYNVGIWGISHPGLKNQNRVMKKVCANLNIDFRMKEFLGVYKGDWYGTMKYKGACHLDMQEPAYASDVECRTTEIIVNPAGYIFRCHSDLYANRYPIGHILDDEIKGIGEWKRCSNYGQCNPCDIKVKTNRLQEYGHTSVEIKEVR